MNFINSEHELNYAKLQEKWASVASGDKEYVSAAYILAIPFIFEKFENTWQTFESPITWIHEWEVKYNERYFEASGYTQDERDELVISYDLTNSMIELGRLALHLWNNTPFSLLDCLCCLDDEHYLAAIFIIKFRTM